MTSSKIQFPKDFLWGSATASYQVEGDIENNDWARAESDAGGRVPVCGIACDHYNRYQEDFDIAKSLGHNCHKISIEWSRIEPREGEFDRKEIEHYKNVLDALRERGLTAFVGIWHFTLPDWFADKGGFLHKDAPKIFARYAAYVAKELGDKISFLITINEPLIYTSNGYLRGLWPPFQKNLFTFVRATNALIRAHKAAYLAIKTVLGNPQTQPKLKIGIAKNNMYFHSNSNPLHLVAVFFMKWFWNNRFLKKINEYQDFVGINYYFHKGWGIHAKHEKTDFGWDICPEGLFHVLMDTRRYGKPVYIIENGLADARDTKRAKFIRDHLLAVHNAIEGGVNVRGYLHWSLLDNYEWAEGFNKRFGLVEVDYTTQKRTVRPSALVYKKICEENAIAV